MDPDLDRAPAALLVRPDGAVARAAEAPDTPGAAAGLDAALHRWTGAPPARVEGVAAASTPD